MPFSNIDGAGLIGLDTVIGLGFYIIAALYIIFTAIFYYHWQQYSVDLGVTRITFIIYFAVTVPLVLIMGISYLYI
jgi:hypothetical protein